MHLRLEPLGRGELDHELLWSVVGLISVGGFLLVRAVLGVEYLPRCSFHALTGQPCLTCGATRSLLALLAGEPLRALRMNPMVCVVLVAWGAFIPYGLVASLAKTRRLRLHLSKREAFSLRFIVPAVALLNWAWLIVDNR